MKSIYKYLAITLLSVTIVSCDLDINENPNFQPDASPEMLVPSGTTWSAALLGGDIQLVGSMWAQHYAQSNVASQYTQVSRYNIPASSSYFTRTWLAYYAGALPDLYLARDKSAANSELGYWVPAQVMIAFDYHILVNLYGTIPFSQVFNAEYPAPAYEDGKVVNAGIIAILDAVIAKQTEILAAENLLEKRDFVFNGDLKSWLQFAKTLKLKVLLYDFEANKTAIQALLAEGDFLKTDARMNGFTNKENNSNPLYENDRRKLNTPNNIRGAATMITYLMANNDPRIAVFYEKNDEESYLGMPQGAGGSITQAQIPFALTNKATLAPEDPVYFLSLAETHFLQAECYARLGDKVKAKTFYEEGVRAAFARWKDSKDWTYSATMVDPFLTGVYKFDDSSLDSMIKSIMMQKWVASVRCQAWNAFFDINRTGYPELGTQYTVLSTNWQTPNPNYVIGTLTPSRGAISSLQGGFPKRFLIPRNSTDNNPNAPKPIPEMGAKLWWQK